MGGLGSGRTSYGARPATEDALPLDIRRLQRAGVLIPGRWFSWQWTVNDRPIADIRVRVESADRVVLVYRYRQIGAAEWDQVEQPVSIERTACTYGGTRPWWSCPSCSRRVAVLYAPGKAYACRHCWSLSYASQREPADDRATRRADKIRRRLGWEAGILNGMGWKPKGMHWRTFEFLSLRHNVFALNAMRMVATRFGWNPDISADMQRDVAG